jgi:hypothetical protein
LTFYEFINFIGADPDPDPDFDFDEKTPGRQWDKCLFLKL